MNRYFLPLIQRICQAAGAALRNADDGMAIVTVKVLMTSDNRPVVWVVSGVDKIEPGSRAESFVELITREAA